MESTVLSFGLVRAKPNQLDSQEDSQRKPAFRNTGTNTDTTTSTSASTERNESHPTSSLIWHGDGSCLVLWGAMGRSVASGRRGRGCGS